MKESGNTEKKSIKFLERKNPDWDELARDCVCLANGHGGTIFIGIEENNSLPPKLQFIQDRNIAEKIHQAIVHRTINVAVTVNIESAENGAEYIKINVLRSAQTIASTTDGRYFIRVSDECHPVPPDEMARLAAEKNAYIWEGQTVRRIALANADPDKKRKFIKDIRQSRRISSFVREKSDNELLDYYFLTTQGLLTNLGILWIGKREDRAKLLYAPAIQVLRYNEQEEKVWKLALDDYSYNPQELLEIVLLQVPDWQESIEISDGIFRKNLPYYQQDVVRELIVNALVHRTYTTRGDVFINIYFDRLEVHSPGRLPFGVTPGNILNQSVRRNELLSKVFYDLGLMEREGSGYDLIYAQLLGSGKPVPVVIDGFDRVTVIVQKQFTNKQIVHLMEKANQEFQLRQKEIITLGLVAQHQSLTASALTKLLDLHDENGLRNWIGRLSELNLLLTRGKTKGTQYYINPEYLRKLNFKGKTTLINIAEHRLEELINIDLETYPLSAISDIHKRIGEEINIHKVRRVIRKMLEANKISSRGDKKWRRYFIEQKM